MKGRRIERTEEREKRGVRERGSESTEEREKDKPALAAVTELEERRRERTAGVDAVTGLGGMREPGARH